MFFLSAPAPVLPQPTPKTKTINKLKLIQKYTHACLLCVRCMHCVCVCTVCTVCMCVCVRFMYAKFAISHSLLMSVEQRPPPQSTAGDPSTVLLRMTLPALRTSLPLSLRTTLLPLRTTSSPARRIAGNLQVGFF